MSDPARPGEESILPRSEVGSNAPLQQLQEQAYQGDDVWVPHTHILDWKGKSEGLDWE